MVGEWTHVEPSNSSGHAPVSVLQLLHTQDLGP